MTGACLGQKQCGLRRPVGRERQDFSNFCGVGFKFAGWERTKNFNPRRTLVWPIILGAGLSTTCCGDWLLVIRFNVTFLPLRPSWEKICICILHDGRSLTMYALILWTLQLHFTLWLSAWLLSVNWRTCAWHNTLIFHLALAKVAF